MNNDTIVTATVHFVKKTLQGAEAGHDWFHIERVYKTALAINEQEQGNTLVVSLAALLHDIADPKFNGGNEQLGPAMARDFMAAQQIAPQTIEHVVQIISHMSFKNSFDKKTFDSKELTIVQDADRLDAIGAIGIARAFTYGGFKNRVLYDPAQQPAVFNNKEAYKTAEGTTINHFYEKLLLLKDKMNTTTGKMMAAERHRIMEEYLNHFYAEWEGKA